MLPFWILFSVGEAPRTACAPSAEASAHQLVRPGARLRKMPSPVSCNGSQMTHQLDSDDDAAPISRSRESTMSRSLPALPATSQCGAVEIK